MIEQVTSVENERGIIASVVRKGADRNEVTEHLDELEFLATTANVEIAARLIQERERPDLASYIGRGKVQELKQLVEDNKAAFVLFDDELSPVQIRNLERELEVKVIDRSALILDIFAHRARTVEARTQVELAQLQYLMPRLSRMWTHLSKQYGGVGTKGPGETQIETDRRIIRYRIQRLKEKLREIDQQKVVQRKQRQSQIRFALVGYTNAGKSTLMNHITGADVYMEDKLFATLDTTVRQFTLPGGQTALLSDTVGFIRKLPAHLIASFRSTLAESIEADMLIHLVDCTNPMYTEHIAVVRETLAGLNIGDKPVLLVFNKIDALEDREQVSALEYEYPGCILLSAATGYNVRSLLSAMQLYVDGLGSDYSMLIPYKNMGDVAALYSVGEILERTDGDDGVEIHLRVLREKEHLIQNKYAEYIRAES
ncbi:MAG: GTPase HflX [Candidatus Kapabacteria bacterium]|nr:GTPase HflX [Candidatus Kapabacteria bacterium]